jgi:hypothetical protein
MPYLTNAYIHTKHTTHYGERAYTVISPTDETLI